MREEGLAELISRVGAEVHGTYGASKALFTLRRMGVRTSMWRVVHIVRGRGWRPSMSSISSPRDKATAFDIFECIEVVYSRAGIHSALGYMSPAELEEANWPDDEDCPRAA